MKRMFCMALFVVGLVAAARDALGQSPAGKPAVADLMRTIEDRDKSVQTRTTAVFRLGEYGPAAKPAIPLLQRCLQDENATLRGKTIETLGKIGKAAVPVLGDALLDKKTQWQAAIEVNRLSPDIKPIVRHIARAIERKESSAATSHLIAALKKMGPDAHEASGALVVAIFQEFNQGKLDQFTIAANREAAAEALRVVCKDRNLVVSTLVKAIRVPTHSQPSFRKDHRNLYAIKALGKMGAAAQEAVPTLKLLLEEDLAKNRKSVDPNIPSTIEALGKIGPAAQDVLPLLRSYLNKSSVDTAAERAIERIKR